MFNTTKQSVQTFNNTQFGDLRVNQQADGNIWFCLADVCKVLELKNPRDVKARLSSKGVATTDTLTAGGVQSMTYINEANLYKCIFQSRKEGAEAFQNWVCDEVLPSIRKQGGYMTARADESAEEVMARALLIAQQTLQRRDERIKVLENENQEQAQLLLAQGSQITEMQGAINEMLPKVSYYDQILQSKSTVCTTQIAADYGMSAKKFNVLLRNYKVQRKVGNQWILYAPYNTMGYTHSETFIPEASTTGKVIMCSRWTQKGRLFLYDFLKKRGVLPLIEQ